MYVGFPAGYVLEGRISKPDGEKQRSGRWGGESLQVISQ
jgi:hypothetical protein